MITEFSLLSVMAESSLPIKKVSFLDSLLISVVGMIIVIAVLAIIAVLVLILSKIFIAIGKKGESKKQAAPPVSSGQKANTAKPVKTTAPSGVTLDGVDEQTAAVIMAIVCDETKIPLNRLSFKSIKLIEEK